MQVFYCGLLGLSISQKYAGPVAKQALTAPLPVVLQALAGTTTAKCLYNLGTRPLAQNSSAWEYLLPDALGSFENLSGSSMTDFIIRPTTSEDAGWMRQFLIERWGSDRMVAHGVMYSPHTLPGFAAFEGDQVIGLITYRVEDEACEVVTIDSVQSGRGIGPSFIVRIFCLRV